MVSSVTHVSLAYVQSPQKSAAAPADSVQEPLSEETEGAIREKIKEAQEVQPADASSGGGAKSVLDTELTEEEEKMIQELQARDREVRAHEQAHKTVGGPYAGVVSYETQTGPDGREYAIGGEVQIDASPIPGNPEATVRKLDVVIRAALAPAEPSSQDFAVARAAQASRLDAQREIQTQRDEELKEQRAENDPNSEDSEGQSLDSVQKTQLQQLLESIDAIRENTENSRGTLINAIN